MSEHCVECGLPQYGPWCLTCLPRRERAELEARLAVMCEDDVRKILGAENFEDQGAYARRARARRILASVGGCVECGATLTSDQKLKSLACKPCVEKLGTDAESGRWNGRPEPSELEKKEVA